MTKSDVEYLIFYDKNLFILNASSNIMAQQGQNVQMPAGFGGLMRFKEEYDSKFNLKPIHVIAFIVLIIAFRVGLGIFYG